MNKIVLYNGDGASLSPKYEEGRTESAYVRLVADDGMMLKNGDVATTCIDVLAADVDNWTEVEYSEQDEDIDDAEALQIILGGDES